MPQLAAAIDGAGQPLSGRSARSMIEVVVVRPWPDSSIDDDLPPYLAEPPSATIAAPRERRVLSTAYRKATAPPGTPCRPGVPFGGQACGVSPVFALNVPVGRSRLAEAVYAWWAAGVEGGVVKVQRRLQLGPPEGDGTIGWAMRGQVRRLTHRRWVPVAVELSPIREHFTRMTMTPQVHVSVSRRYFRIGHSVLARLSAELAETSARMDMTPRLSPTGADSLTDTAKVPVCVQTGRSTGSGVPGPSTARYRYESPTA
jgi:hypothetical protein